MHIFNLQDICNRDNKLNTHIQVYVIQGIHIDIDGAFGFVGMYISDTFWINEKCRSTWM